MSLSQQKSSPPEQGAFRPRPHCSGTKKGPAAPRPGWVFARLRCCRRHRRNCRRRSCRRYRRRRLLTRRRQEPVSLIGSLRRRESLRRDWRLPLPSSPRLHLWSQALSKTQVRLSRGLQRDVIYFGWPIASSYMSPNAGGGWGVLRGLSQ